LWAEPLGVVPKFAPLDDGCSSTELSPTLLFVGTNNLGVSVFSSALCAVYGESEDSYSLPLDALDQRSDDSEAKRLPEIEAGLRKGCEERKTQREKAVCRARLSQRITRADGHWKPISPKLTGYDSLTPEWAEIKKRFPTAYDAVSSPDNRLVAVFTPEAITLHSPKDLGNPLAAIPQWTEMRLLMAQWATAGYVKKWEDDLAGASAKMRAVDAAFNPKMEAKFRLVENSELSDFESGLPRITVADWLRATFPDRQFVWDYGACVQDLSNWREVSCTSVEFPLDDGRTVRLSFDAGPLDAEEGPDFFAGYVKGGRTYFVVKKLSELPDTLARKLPAD
jgi:hypothetical protein